MSDIVERLRAWSPLIASGLEVPAASLAAEEAADEITRLRARVEELERQHPVVATAGCQCPSGANIHCANSWCPRKSLSFRVTSASASK
jgi:hypothetical protein